MELLSLKNASKEFKIELLKALGLSVDEKDLYVMKDGRPYLDKYSEKPVRFSNMAIFPGSAIIIDDNLLSVASYLDEHSEVM